MQTRKARRCEASACIILGFSGQQEAFTSLTYRDREKERDREIEKEREI